MKSKVLRKTLAIAMSAATLLTSAVSVTAFAADVEPIQAASESNYQPVENHSIIDCTNRYKMNDGKFNFTIKLPAGTDLSDVTLEITMNDKGDRLFYDNFMYFSVPGTFGTTVTFKESYDGSDYYEFITHNFVNAGVGIKLFMQYNGVRYMATDTSNGSYTEGRGYWLSV